MAEKKRPAAPHNLVYLNRDRGYRFTDRDPQMIELCKLIDDSGMGVVEICREVSKSTGGAYNVASSTVYNWLNGKTRRPQSYTMNWVAYAIGYERVWRKMK